MSLRPYRQAGFTFLGLLFLMAGLGVTLAALGTLWHTVSRHDKEAQLLYVGDQYRRAITSFWQAGGEGQRRLPKSLDELLLDPRFPQTVRHLRRLYPDPMSADGEWVLFRDQAGGILGLHSRSREKPFKTLGFAPAYSEFAGKTEYREWVFAASAGAGSPTPMAAPADTTAGDGPIPASPPAFEPATLPAATVEPPPPERRRACVLERGQTQISRCNPLAGNERQACLSAAQNRFLDCLRGD